ncbi:MAG: hypothetical protein RL320_1398 [Pseudomonadota bacterium]
MGASSARTEPPQHVDFIVVLRLHPQGARHPPDLNEAAGFVQTQRRFIGRCHGERDLLNAWPLGHLIEGGEQKLLTVSFASIARRHEHASNERDVSFLCPLLATYADDTDQLPGVKAAEELSLL